MHEHWHTWRGTTENGFSVGLDLELARHRLLRARTEPGVEDLGRLARRLDVQQGAIDGVLEARLALLQGEADIARLGEVGKKQIVVGTSGPLHDRAQHALVGGNASTLPSSSAAKATA